MDAVAIDDATKTYGKQIAVNRLGLRVPRGSVYGFIGPNGSGKSTTLRMIMRIILPDSGRIEVLGETGSRAANDRIGYLPEERNIYRKMKVRDVLCFFAELKGMRRPLPHVEEWLERLDLAEHGNKRVEALSKGMGQKVQFIATVVARPELVILDEPFSGLDPVNMDVVRDAVLELQRGGATVIFSTHDMGVAERMCDFIFMIYKGNKVLDGTLDSIQNEYGADTLRISLSGNRGAEAYAGLPGVEEVRDLGNYQEVRLVKNADSQPILHALLSRGRVERFEVARPSLHDIFVRIARPEVDAEESEPALHA